ncbi:phosphoribosylpyrophosphate synthetase [compost metagenome]
MSKRNWNRTVLVAPDAGAMKKTLELANLVGCPRVVCAFKDRDTVTGKITATRVDMTFTPTLDQDWLVVDDICDGGYTFIELAKVLRTMFDEHGLTNRLELWVSHGLFTKGYDVLKEHYARIETTNSWNALGSYNTQPDGTHDAAIYWHPVQGIFA